jgi:hypothetical protein
MRRAIFQAAICAGAGLAGLTPGWQSARAQEYIFPPQSVAPAGASSAPPAPLGVPSPYELSTQAVADGVPPAPTIHDPALMMEHFPESPGLLAEYPPESIPHHIQPAGMIGMSMPFLAGPQESAPNMIGDFFGVSARRSLLSLQTDSFHFTGTYRGSNGRLVRFPATPDPLTDYIDLTAPSALTVSGDAEGTIPAGSTWFSDGPQGSSSPRVFPLAENPDETLATLAAFPDADNVEFVEGEASRIRGTTDEYSIYTDYFIDQPSPVMSIVIPDPGAAPGAFVGRQKIAENSSPLPRTRVFVNYSYLSDAPLTPAGTNISRVTPGFELAFLNDNVSVEVRAPFASTLDSDMDFNGLTSTDDIAFGNLTMYLKALMWSSDTFSWSAGLGMTVPTADDFTVKLDGLKALEIQNEAYHLLPFLGFLWTPRERVFVQGFLQYDIDANGNAVSMARFDEGIPEGPLRRIGRADDSTYAFVDLGIGYWMYRDRHCRGFINGIAPTLEVHYNAATNGADTVNRADFAGLGANVWVGTPGDLEVTNMVFGLTSLICDSGTFTLGYATPVAGDDQSDGEFRAFFNWYLGRRNY